MTGSRRKRPSRSRTQRWVAAFALPLALGCDPAADAAGAPASIGAGPVLEASRLALGTAWTTVGSATSDEPPLFGVKNVVEHEHGRFFVLNVGDGRIASYESTGVYVSDVGRKGGGPGEFQVPVDIALADDQLLVLDPQASRLSRFSVDDLRLASTLSLDMRNGVAMDVECCADGGAPLVSVDPVPGMTTDTARRVVVLGDDGTAAAIVSLDVAADPIPVTYVADGRRVTTFVTPPFAPVTSWAAAPDGRVVWGDGSAYSVWQRATGGGREAAVSDPDAERTAVTADDRERFERSLPDDVDPGSLDLTFPETKPHFTAVRFAADRSLWLKTRSAASGESWDIWRDGDRAGSLRLPERWRLVGLGPSSIFVVEVSDLDEEILHRIPLIEG